MNYLVHLYLAGNDTDLIIGNFIADHVKGKQYLSYSEGVQKGILMHRAIDHFTDHHPLVIEAKKYFSKHFGLASGILIDIFFDHFFAQEWVVFNPNITLKNFTDNIHQVLKNKIDILPERSQRFLSYMLEYNILYNYQFENGIHRTLEGISKRLKNKFLLHEAMPIMLNKKMELLQLYTPFMLELITEFKQ
jgi:acyl carrier protein phosphodiesterase